MPKLIEKINTIISTIDNNLSEELNRPEINKLLENVWDELDNLEKNTENDYKTIVSTKVKSLKDIVDNNIPKWLETKNDLTNIKTGLEELKKEIMRLEEPIVKRGLASSGALTIDQEEDLGLAYSELVKWRYLFNGKTPEEVAKNIGSKKVESVNELFNGMHERGERWTTESADKLLPGLAGQIPGTKVAVGLVTGGISVISGGAAIGVHEFDRTTDNLKELTVEGMENLKDLTEHITDSVTGLTGKAMDNTAKVTESFFGIFKSESKTLEEKLKSSEELINLLQQQLKKKDEEFKQRLVDRDKRLERKNEEISKLQEQLNSLTNRLIAQVEHKPYGGQS